MKRTAKSIPQGCFLLRIQNQPSALGASLLDKCAGMPENTKHGP